MEKLNVLPLLFVRSVLPFGSFPNCYIYPHLQIVGGQSHFMSYLLIESPFGYVD